MSKAFSRMRQLVDWRAALWAGFLSGLVFFLLTLFLLPKVTGGNAWVMMRFMASLSLGQEILPPPPSFNAEAMIVAVLTNLILTHFFGLFVAYVIHRGGLLLGILGGAILGLATYAINFYALTYFFPWFFPLRGCLTAVNHVVLGALAGGIYEWLEEERFVSVEN
jgi:xanthine/uracil/vitamin C permease (AzgA family)